VARKKGQVPRQREKVKKRERPLVVVDQAVSQVNRVFPVPHNVNIERKQLLLLSCTARAPPGGGGPGGESGQQAPGVSQYGTFGHLGLSP
jgi:hypothetical protein